MTTKWELADRVSNRIKDKPAALGSAILVEYVEDAAQDVQNFTNLSVDLTSIGSKFHPVMTNLAHMYALDYMSNVGVSYDLGRTKIKKKTEAEGLKNQLMILQTKTDKQLNDLGRKINQDTLNPSEMSI